MLSFWNFHTIDTGAMKQFLPRPLIPFPRSLPAPERGRLRNGNPFLGIVSAAILLHFGPAPAQTIIPKILDRAYLQGVPYPGLLYPSTMGIDQRRGLLYVFAPGYPHIAVVDMGSRSETGTIPVGTIGGDRIRVHCVEPETRTVVLSRLLADSSGHRTELVSVSVISNGISARRNLGPCGYIGVIPHPSLPRIIVSTGGRSILLLDPVSLTVMDSIDAGMRTGGISADSVDQTLVAVESEVRSDSIRMKLISLRNLETLRIFIYQADEPLPDVVIDPSLKRFALFGGGLVRYFDETGLPVHQFRVSGRIGRHAFLPLTHQLCFLDSAGNTEEGKGGRYGKLFRYSLQGIDIDSFSVGPDARDLAINQRAAEAAVLAQGSATVEISHAPSMQRLALVRLGHGAHDLITDSNGSHLYIANAAGSGDGITRVDLTRDRVEPDISVGSGPVRFGRLSDGGVAVYNHFNSTCAILDRETGRVERTVRIQGVTEGRTDVFPSISINGADILLTALPEQGRYVLTDLRSSMRIRSAAVDGYLFSQADPQDGAVQAAWIPDTDFFALLLFRQRRLNLYRVGSDTMLFAMDLSGLDWNLVQAIPSQALRSGASPGEAFIGPYRFDAVRREIQLVTRGRASVVEAISGSEVLFLESSAKTWELKTFDVPSGRTRATAVLSVDSAFLPTTVWSDHRSRRLCLADKRTGKVLVFNTSTMTDIRIIAQIQTAPLSIYPHPAHFGRDRGFILENVSAMHGVTIRINDLSGNELWKSSGLDLSGGATFIRTDEFEPPAGMYIMTVENPGTRRIMKFLSVK